MVLDPPYAEGPRLVLAAVYGPSIVGPVATGERAGRRVERVGDKVAVEEVEPIVSPRCARGQGFSLHADVAVPAFDRRRLERLEGRGRITRIEGLDAVRQRAGDGLVVADLLEVGQRRRNWKNTRLGDGYVTLRSVDYDDLCGMRDVAVQQLRMYAE